MVDFTTDFKFGALLDATERVIDVLALGGVRDAIRLVDRAAGWNNLQGHMRAIVPLTVWVAWRRPELLCTIRAETNLDHEMSSSSQEARAAFWEDVKSALTLLLDQHGDDHVAIGVQANSPETARDIASTYLSSDYGGGQSTGGGGTTVLKRTLKLLAHTLPIDCK